MVTIALGSKTATDPSGFIFVDAVTKTNVTNVKKGDTVVWTNPTKADHTVTADPGQAATFDSGDFAPNGKPFSFTFNQAGTFTYTCQDHQGQVGKVVVS